MLEYLMTRELTLNSLIQYGEDYGPINKDEGLTGKIIHTGEPL